MLVSSKDNHLGGGVGGGGGVHNIGKCARHINYNVMGQGTPLKMAVLVLDAVHS